MHGDVIVMCVKGLMVLIIWYSKNCLLKPPWARGIWPQYGGGLFGMVWTNWVHNTII